LDQLSAQGQRKQAQGLAERGWSTWIGILREETKRDDRGNNRAMKMLSVLGAAWPPTPADVFTCTTPNATNRKMKG